ncbi:MAG: hypothetical protein ACREQN_18115 [Candidatus Binataceae bacterium]
MAAVFAAGIFAIPFSPCGARSAMTGRSPVPSAVSLSDARGVYGAHIRVAQDDEGDDESQVPPGQVQKYIAVYKAMHNDRGMTVEQAAAKQGMTLAQFRDLESRIERDDAAREHVRDALQRAAKSLPHSAAVPPAGSATPAR